MKLQSLDLTLTHSPEKKEESVDQSEEESIEDSEEEKPVIIKAVVVYIPTYENNPKMNENQQKK